KQLRSKLEQIDGFTVRDIGQRQSGIVTFTAEQHSAETIKDKLADDQINVSISPKSSTLMDMKNRGLDQVVRASVHYYNTAEEIDRLATALKDLSSG
ncbi:MAG TPA: aminotransferase class V-fold PLP-dependent enzyme, partial [Fodinibius sp.]|nr:aminotransferase class V-fold PLP-dependent enzyme [Fodinibius sp.]